MFAVTVKTTFLVEREEQAKYVVELYEKLHALLEVSSSSMSSDITKLPE